MFTCAYEHKQKFIVNSCLNHQLQITTLGENQVKLTM